VTTVAILTAAGQGKRMGAPKQFIEFEGITMLERTLLVFENTAVIDEIILVVNPDDIKRAKKFNFAKLKQVIAGGQERQDSVSAGLAVLPSDCEIVVVHDGARPLVTSEIIEQAVQVAEESGAVVVGVPVKDTVKMSNVKCPMSKDGVTILKTLDRNCLWLAQTPQVFKKKIILEAFKKFGQEKVTDDAMMVEKLGVPVTMVMGSYANIKITTPEDLLIAKALLKTLETSE